MNGVDIFNDFQKFEEKALDMFYYQATENEIYSTYLKHLKTDVFAITTIEEIPFLPISFFKTNRVVCQNLKIERVFKSSGTGLSRSTHYIVDSQIYKASFTRHFEQEFGSLSEICILGLLPNYQKNPDSSLLFMMNELIERTIENGSAYLSLDDKQLTQQLQKANSSGLKTILVGVSFALLDLAEKEPIDLSNVIIMETGGMKGQRTEITRQELHHQLCKAFNVQSVYSEYGMCELLSQAYAAEKGRFTCPNWMKVYSRPMQEPYSKMVVGKPGVLKIVDLANLYSCSFIETEDIGVVHKDGSFEVQGRMDHAALRGCNLMHT